LDPLYGNKKLFTPSYITLYKTGGLKKRIDCAESILSYCTSCPRECRVNRVKGQLGFCKSNELPIISSYTLHHGEEPVLSGINGAGNIFFGNCNLRCIYCQNFEISQNWYREAEHQVTIEKLAEIMIDLQNRGAHNIGLVSPTHFSIQILKSIYIAVEKGLKLPIVYNSNGYDSVQILKLFGGVIDIYLPDIKYGCNENGKTYSLAENYFDVTKEAVKEMLRQVGDKLLVENNLVKRGMIIRHLILPNRLSESENVFKFIAHELHNNISVSLMSQYYPANKAFNEVLLNRTITHSEYYRAIQMFEKYGLKNGWTQEIDSNNHYQPQFKNNRIDPFGF
jgi:putative pyruvate formate lyase activating enzyme